MRREAEIEALEEYIRARADPAYWVLRRYPKLGVVFWHAKIKEVIRNVEDAKQRLKTLREV